MKRKKPDIYDDARIIIERHREKGREEGAAEERAKIVAWLMREEEGYPSADYSGFAAMIREEIEEGEHLK